MMVLPKLATGLDVNVRFTGVADFEYTPECIVFDLLGIPLYHGWLVDPQVAHHNPPPLGGKFGWGDWRSWGSDLGLLGAAGGNGGGNATRARGW